MRFRTGRRCLRTIYAQYGEVASDTDQIVGLVDSAELASFLARAANVQLEQGAAPPLPAPGD